MPHENSVKESGQGQGLAGLGALLLKCTKCGECRSVCPVFNELGEEKYVARGKLALVDALGAGELPPTDALREALEQCLLCLSCEARCGSGVPVSRIITEARAELARDLGRPLPKRMLYRLLASGRGMVNLAFRTGSLLQPFLFRRIPGTSGLKRRFPLPLVDRDLHVPRLALRPFRSREERFFPAPDSRDTVVFFTGCLTNFIHTQTAGSVVKVLNSLGISVIVPGDQACCGAPAHAGGDFGAAGNLARMNLKALNRGRAGGKKVVVPCASGGYMLKSVYSLLMQDDPVYGELAAVTAQRTFDISEYLVNHVGLGNISPHVKSHLSGPVTCHDPCHLNRGQGIREEPRALLKIVCDEFAEMEDPGTCCGSGGIYGITHRDTSKRILEKKIRSILDSGAGIVSTGCPGCIIQITGGLLQRGSMVEATHTIQLLARAMGLV
ncbi:MAG: (Fe-S)-binding protein [Deltaproteobacteria bacterium]|nr:(Fe-S)-binding protein [Deltaproteobacteria bacterium]